MVIGQPYLNSISKFFAKQIHDIPRILCVANIDNSLPGCLGIIETGVDLVVRDLACHVISLNSGCLWVTPSAIPGLHSYLYLYSFVVFLLRQRTNLALF